MNDLFSQGNRPEGPPIGGGGRYFTAKSARLGRIHGYFSLSANAIRLLIRAIREDKVDDRRLITTIIQMMCYYELAPHQFRPIGETELPLLQDQDLNNVTEAITKAEPSFQQLTFWGVPGGDPNRLYQPHQQFARIIRHVLGLSPTYDDKGISSWANITTHLADGQGKSSGTIESLIRNANTSFTVASLAKSISDSEPKIVRGVKTQDSSSGLTHMMGTEGDPLIAELVSHSRKSAELQGKTAELIGQLNDALLGLIDDYTQQQKLETEKYLQQQKAERIKDSRNVRIALWGLGATAIFGLIGAGIALAAYLNDLSGGDETRAEAEKTRYAIETSSQREQDALVKALQAIQAQQANDAKVSREQLQLVIDAIRNSQPGQPSTQGRQAISPKKSQ